MKICHIVGGGDFSADLLQCNEGDIIIAADSGYSALLRSGISPTITVGDFDSLRDDIPQGAIILPTHKDDTDISAAIKEGERRGFKEFRLYGALGGTRFSHSIANLSLLTSISTHGGSGKIIDPLCEILLLDTGTHIIKKERFKKVSFFPEGCSANISLLGFEYPLSHYSIKYDFPLGVSNELTDDCGEITIHSGKVFCIFDD